MNTAYNIFEVSGNKRAMETVFSETAETAMQDYVNRNSLCGFFLRENENESKFHSDDGKIYLTERNRWI